MSDRDRNQARINHQTYIVEESDDCFGGQSEMSCTGYSDVPTSNSTAQGQGEIRQAMLSLAERIHDTLEESTRTYTYASILDSIISTNATAELEDFDLELRLCGLKYRIVEFESLMSVGETKKAATGVNNLVKTVDSLKSRYPNVEIGFPLRDMLERSFYTQLNEGRAIDWITLGKTSSALLKRNLSSSQTAVANAMVCYVMGLSAHKHPGLKYGSDMTEDFAILCLRATDGLEGIEDYDNVRMGCYRFLKYVHEIDRRDVIGAKFWDEKMKEIEDYQDEPRRTPKPVDEDIEAREHLLRPPTPLTSSAMRTPPIKYSMKQLVEFRIEKLRTDRIMGYLRNLGGICVVLGVPTSLIVGIHLLFFGQL